MAAYHLRPRWVGRAGAAANGILAATRNQLQYPLCACSGQQGSLRLRQTIHAPTESRATHVLEAVQFSRKADAPSARDVPAFSGRLEHHEHRFTCKACKALHQRLKKSGSGLVKSRASRLVSSVLSFASAAVQDDHKCGGMASWREARVQRCPDRGGHHLGRHHAHFRVQHAGAVSSLSLFGRLGDFRVSDGP